LFLAAAAACVAQAAQAEPANLLVNGSFEYWTKWMAWGVTNAANGVLTPVRWQTAQPSQQQWTRSADAHSGSNAVATKHGVRLTMGVIEAFTGVEYSYGVWIKAGGQGRGTVRMRVEGHAREGIQKLAEASGTATSVWQRVGGSLKVPGHIGLVTFVIESAGELVLDDACFSAELDAPYDADRVLREKYGRDADTLLLEDFEAGLGAFTIPGKRNGIVDDGKFGRALRVFQPDPAASLPLSIASMPPEGTLEFWISQDDFLKGAFVELSAGQKHIVGFGGDYWHPLKLQCSSDLGVQRMRGGQWMHVALTWDGEFLRYYTDGMLAAVLAQPPDFWKTSPSNLLIGSPLEWLCWNGRVDEIRLSKVRRYGPVLPKGAQPKPRPVASSPAAAAAAAPAVQRTDLEVQAKARSALITPLPAVPAGNWENRLTPEGTYVYEAPSARPLVQDAVFAIVTNKALNGLAVARIANKRWRGENMVFGNSEGLYWRLGAIQPAPYWIGLIYRSDDGHREEVRSNGEMMPNLYLNNRIVQMDAHTSPVQVGPGWWFAEARTAAPLDLKPGDELAVGTLWASQPHLARLILYTRAPPRAPHPMPVNFGGSRSDMPTSLGLSAEPYFTDTATNLIFHRVWVWPEQVAAGAQDLQRGVDGRPVATVEIINPLPVPLTVAYRSEVQAHFMKRVGGEELQLTLAAHQRVTRLVPFDLLPGEPGYSIRVELKAVKRPELGWPEGDTIAYFPGLRHTMAWDSPFEAVGYRRLEFSNKTDGQRTQIDLDGAWQIALTPELDPPFPPPAGLEFKPGKVPHANMHWANVTPRPHGEFLRRTFELGADAAERTFTLHITNLRDEGTAWVNGVRVGNVRGGMTPLIADATAALRPGTNEIVILVRDLIALMNPAYVNTNAPVGNPFYLDAPGYFSAAWGCGIGNVRLEVAPRVAPLDLVIVPSVRQKQLEARMNLVNQRAAAVKVKVNATVLDGGKTVFELGEQTVDLAAGATQPLVLSRPWAQPRLWGPNDPYLYTLRVETTDAGSGTALDTVRQRFGFREVWIEGPHIVLNGTPMKRRGGWGGTPKPGWVGESLSRGTPVPDAWAELGWMGFHPITTLFNHACRHNTERDVYWETAERNALTAMRPFLNNTATIAWDLSNEYYWYGGSPQLAQRMKKLSDTVRAADPTRWTLANGDGDIGGELDNYAFHYMDPSFGWERAHGRTAYSPDDQYWRPLDKSFGPDPEIPLAPFYATLKMRPERKLIMNTEHLWKTGPTTMPPGTTLWGGEETVLSPAVDGMGGPVVWMWRTRVDGHRDLGVSLLQTYGLPGSERRAMNLQTFILPDVAHHAFGGRELVRLYSVHNDVFRDARLTFRWELRDGRGTVKAHGKDVYGMHSADTGRGEIRFKAPRVSERTTFTLRTRLEEDGRFLVGQENDLDVWPDVPVKVGTLARKVLLFEPEGSGTSNAQRPTPNIQHPTAQALSDAGVPFARVSDMSSLLTSHSSPVTLILAENALNVSNAFDCLRLQRFVEDGGRVLVLRQNVAPAGLPAVSKLDPVQWASQCFVRMATHPILAGLTSWDLHFWANDRSVGQGAYGKPESGSVVTLVDSGSPEGLEWVQLMEQFRGKGSYVLCQLPVVGKYDEEPMARELLARLVAYAAGAGAFATPTNMLTVLAAADSAVVKRLEEIGAKIEVVQHPTTNNQHPTPNSVLLHAPTGRTLSAEDRLALANALRGGGTVVVAGATLADTNWLGTLVGAPVTMTVPTYHVWHGRGMRSGFSPFTAGLSHQDLYWKRYEGAESGGSQAEQVEYALEALQDYSVFVEGARELVFPRAMLEVPVGKGRVILDQRRWTTAHPDLQRLANRNVSALLAGLDVAIAPAVAMRELPKTVDYRTIDLTPFGNRALADDKSDDGIGGWTDQGADADLRTFPTGLQRFQNVPFQIGTGSNAVLVMSTPGRPGRDRLPTEVTIPVGRTVEGFYFLHAAAYGGRNLVTYEIHYADGQMEEIPVWGGINILDWVSAASPAFTRERGTRSSVAWTGSCPAFTGVSIYKMLWVNPRSEQPVKAVRVVKNPERGGVPLLLGLTAVVQPEGAAAVKAPAADPARAQARTAEAQKALAAKDLAQAERLAREAIAADPSHEPAYAMLLDIVEQRKDESLVLAVCRLWTGAGGKSPMPWNRIGEILEQRKDYRGALEAYKQSLVVEWNQPPTIEARKRLEAMLGR
jgi:hypothetical protein